MGNVHMKSTECEGVKGKAENDTRVTRQRAVPFEVFSLHFPLIAWGSLVTGGEVEEVGGRAIGETHDKREEAPTAEVSDLVSDLPTVVIKCVGEVIKRGVRLRDEVTQGLMIKTGRTNCEDTLAVAAHGAQGVESTGGKFVGKGEEDYAEAFASGESNKVTSLSFSRVGQETGHLDREEEGSGATNANGFNCIRESAVRGKETWEVFDKVNNGRERGYGFQLLDEGGIIFDVSVDSEIGDAVGFGVHPLIVMVAFWKFGETGGEIVDTVERHQVEIIESRREVGGRRT